MLNRILVALGVGLLGVFLVATCGCALYRRKRQWMKPPVETPASSGEPYALGVVELDEQGWVCRDQLARVLNLVDDQAGPGGALIVAYIHGWHHSADPEDLDLGSFRKMLTRLAAATASEPKQLFADIIPPHATPVVGVYIGWRGASLPMPLDYATFWERKAASERVGHAEIGEVLAGLDRIYQDRNRQGRFTNLIIIGHSFGGSVLFGATSDVFKQRLAARRRDITKKGDSARFATPDSLTFTHPADDEVLEGVGDLVVLVNPAIEASQYEPIASLANDQTYPASQHPVLLTVSAENDGARNVFFPIGRWFSTLSQPKPDPQQTKEMRTAMGNHPPHITHCLMITGGQACRRTPGMPACSPTPRALNGNEYALLAASAPRAFASPAAPGTQLCPARPGIDTTNPFLVAQATPAVVNGHSGQFSAAFREFLVAFITQTRHQRARALQERRALQIP